MMNSLTEFINWDLNQNWFIRYISILFPLYYIWKMYKSTLLSKCMNKMKDQFFSFFPFSFSHLLFCRDVLCFSKSNLKQVTECFKIFFCTREECVYFCRTVHIGVKTFFFYDICCLFTGFKSGCSWFWTLRLNSHIKLTVQVCSPPASVSYTTLSLDGAYFSIL